MQTLSNKLTQLTYIDGEARADNSGLAKVAGFQFMRNCNAIKINPSTIIT